MLKFLVSCLRSFGLFRGFVIYFRIKILKSDSFKIPGLPNPIYFRPGTVDISTFREIFLRKEYALDLPESFKPKLIIDAGANIGFTTLFFLNRYPGSTIISLEPDPGNFKLLKKNSAGYSGLRPIQKALWHHEGFIEVFDQGYGLRGFTVGDAREPGTGLPATTIRELLKTSQFTQIDILKIDIEGSEKEVFEADTTWLSRTRCLVIELHDRMKPGCSAAVFKAIAQYNFEFSIRGENLIFVNKDPG